MTDEERDQIDTDAETYMRTCSVAIQSLKTEGINIEHENNIKKNYKMIHTVVVHQAGVYL